MNYSVNAADGIFEASSVQEIVNLNEIKSACGLRSCSDHLVAFRQRPSRAANSDSFRQEAVDDVRADESSRPSDENTLSIALVCEYDILNRKAW
jgi:hypothetical protein